MIFKLGFCLYLIFASSVLFSESVIGYGSSDALLSPKSQELFFMGFKHGLENELKDKKIINNMLVNQISDKSLLGAIRSSQSLLDKKVLVIAGFPTSHEALLASKTIKNNGNDILAIFSGAGHSDLAKMGPNIYTTGESMKYSVESTIHFIQKKFPLKNGLIINNPYAVFSKNQLDILQSSLLKNEYKNVRIKIIDLSKDLTIDEKIIQTIKKSKFDYICILPYAEESAKLLEALEKNKIDLPIITNSSWTTGDIDFLRRFLILRRSPVYSATNWQKGSKESEAFEKSFELKYGKQPSAEAAYGHDLGIIVATTINKSKTPLTRKSLIESFHQNSCFKKTTSGKMCFSKNGGHAQRNLIFVQFTKNGFKKVD